MGLVKSFSQLLSLLSIHFDESFPALQGAVYSPRNSLSLVDNLPRPPPKSERSNVPIGRVLRSITPMQYAMFTTAWIAWLCDAIDFFGVS